MKTHRSLKHIGSLGLVALGLSSCGPLVSYSPTAPRDAYQSLVATQSQNSAATASTSACKNREANILPNHDWNVGDIGKYKVCASETNSYTIEIHGQTAESDTICIFPAQYYAADPSRGLDQARIIWKLDRNGFPMYQCVQVTGTNGVLVTFDRTNFDFVFIAELPKRDDIRQCLLANNEVLCPAHSRGRFR